MICSLISSVGASTNPDLPLSLSAWGRWGSMGERKGREGAGLSMPHWWRRWQLPSYLQFWGTSFVFAEQKLRRQDSSHGGQAPQEVPPARAACCGIASGDQLCWLGLSCRAWCVFSGVCHAPPRWLVFAGGQEISNGQATRGRKAGRRGGRQDK